MGDPDPGHQPGGAHAARPDADLDGVRPGLDQVTGTIAGRHVAGDHVGIGAEFTFEVTDRFERMVGVTVGDVEHQGVTALGHQRLAPLDEVFVGPYRSADQQPLRP